MNRRNRNSKSKKLHFILLTYCISLLCGLSMCWGSIKVNGSEVVKKNGDLDLEKLEGTNASMAQGNSIILSSQSLGTGIKGLGNLRIQNLTRKKKLKAVNNGKIQTMNINQNQQIVGGGLGGLDFSSMDLLNMGNKNNSKSKRKKQNLKKKIEKRLKHKLSQTKTKKNRPRSIQVKRNIKTTIGDKKNEVNFDTIESPKLKKNFNLFKNKIKKQQIKNKKKEVFNVNILNSKKLKVKGINYKPINNSDAFGPQKKLENKSKIFKKKPGFIFNKSLKTLFKNSVIKKIIPRSKFEKLKKKKISHLKNINQQIIKSTKVKMRLTDLKQKGSKKITEKPHKIKKKVSKIRSPFFMNSILTEKTKSQVLKKKLNKKVEAISIKKSVSYDLILIRPKQSNSTSYSIADLLSHVKLKPQKNSKSKIYKNDNKENIVKKFRPVTSGNKYKIDQAFFSQYIKKKKPFNIIKLRKTINKSKGIFFNPAVKIKKSSFKKTKQNNSKGIYTKKKFSNSF